MSRKRGKSVAQLLREVAELDPKGHAERLGRGYGVGPEVDDRIVMSPGVYARSLADAHARGVEDALRPVLDLVRKSRKISPSSRAVVYVADLERALGRDAARPHKTGGNDV